MKHTKFKCIKRSHKKERCLIFKINLNFIDLSLLSRCVCLRENVCFASISTINCY